MDKDEDEREDEESTSPEEKRKREGTTADLRERLRRLEQEFDVLHGQVDEDQIEQLVRYLDWLSDDPTLENRPADSDALYEDLGAAESLRVSWGRLLASRGEALSVIELAEQKEFFWEVDATFDIYEKNVRDTAENLHGSQLDNIVSRIRDVSSSDHYIEWKNERPSWRVANVDRVFPKGHLQTIEGVLGLLDVLRSYETMTWGEIEQSPHCHQWESTEEWDPKANARLVGLNLNAKSGWWQLRANRMQRIFGYREGPVFNIVWHDLMHEVYRTKYKK